MSAWQRPVAVTAGATAMVLLLVAAHLFTGRSELSSADTLRALVGQPAHPAHEVIVWSYRLPRVLVGLGAGALLAVSGVLAQSVLRNPLTEPATTGVGAGAALGVVSALVLWPGHAHSYLAAIVGASVTGVVLAAIGRRSFALTGVLLGACLSALTSLILVVDSAPIATLMRWLVGSLNGRTPEDFAALWPWLLIMLPTAWLCAPALNILALGVASATGLGVRVRTMSAVTLMLAVCAAAAAIAAAGAVGFIGLIAPHLARRAVGLDHRWLIPVSALVGAGLLSVADVVAFSISLQVPGVATDVYGVPVGAVTALLGAPALMHLLNLEDRR